MNENAKMWARELPCFKQGEPGRLGSVEAGYCCLGVACAIYERETGDTLPKRDKGFYLPERGAECLYGPFACVMEWLGLRDDCGVINEDLALAQLNDDGRTFTEIQQIILSEPEGLFIEGQ